MFTDIDVNVLKNAPSLRVVNLSNNPLTLPCRKALEEAFQIVSERTDNSTGLQVVLAADEDDDDWKIEWFSTPVRLPEQNYFLPLWSRAAQFTSSRTWVLLHHRLPSVNPPWKWVFFQHLTVFLCVFLYEVKKPKVHWGMRLQILYLYTNTCKFLFVFIYTSAMGFMWESKGCDFWVSCLLMSKTFINFVSSHKTSRWTNINVAIYANTNIIVFAVIQWINIDFNYFN